MFMVLYGPLHINVHGAVRYTELLRMLGALYGVLKDLTCYRFCVMYQYIHNVLISSVTTHT